MSPVDAKVLSAMEAYACGHGVGYEKGRETAQREADACERSNHERTLFIGVVFGIAIGSLLALIATGAFL